MCTTLAATNAAVAPIKFGQFERALSVIDQHLDRHLHTLPAVTRPIFLNNQAEALTELGRRDDAAEVTSRHGLHLNSGRRPAAEPLEPLGRDDLLLKRADDTELR